MKKKYTPPEVKQLVKDKYGPFDHGYFSYSSFIVITLYLDSHKSPNINYSVNSCS